MKEFIALIIIGVAYAIYTTIVNKELLEKEKEAMRKKMCSYNRDKRYVKTNAGIVMYKRAN